MHLFVFFKAYPRPGNAKVGTYKPTFFGGCNLPARIGNRNISFAKSKWGKIPTIPICGLNLLDPFETIE